MPAAEFVALAILLVTIIGLLRQPFGNRDWMWTMAAAAIVLATGLLSLQDAESTLASVVGVLLFLLGVAVVAELSSHAGVFQNIAGILAAHPAGVGGDSIDAVAVVPQRPHQPI